jgi:hypothetical protein
LANSLSNVSERLLFTTRYKRLCRESGTETLADATRLAGTLIRWLEDLVESPPRRPGGASTSEEKADDFLFFSTQMADALMMAADDASRLGGNTAVYPSLPRPAQSAWNRLMTQHLPHLPLSVQAVLCVSTSSVWGRENVEDILSVQSAVLAAALPRIISNDLLLPVGGGRRVWYGYRLFALTVLARHLAHGDTSAIFAEPFSGAPRRLSLLYFESLLCSYVPARRTFESEVHSVSTVQY